MTQLDELRAYASQGDMCVGINGHSGQMDTEPSAVWVVIGPADGDNALLVACSMSADEGEARVTITAFRDGVAAEPAVLALEHTLSVSVRLD